MSTLGRKPTFTRLTAFQMLENRRLYGGTTCCADDFIELMVQAGELSKPCSRVTMARLLNGTLFPDLCNFVPDGKGGFEEGMDPYDYDSLPRRPNGRPPKPERVRNDGTMRPRYTASQKQLVDEFTRIAEETAANAGELIARRYGEILAKEAAALRVSYDAMQAEVTVMQAEVTAMQAKVAVLEAGRPA